MTSSTTQEISRAMALEAASALQAISNSPIRPKRGPSHLLQSPAPQSPFHDFPMSGNGFSNRRFENVSLTNTPVHVDHRQVLMAFTPKDVPTLSRPSQGEPLQTGAVALLSLQNKSFSDRLAEEFDAVPAGGQNRSPGPSRSRKSSLTRSDLDPQDIGPPTLAVAVTPLHSSRSGSRGGPPQQIDPRTPLSQLASQRTRSIARRSTADAVPATDDDTQEASGGDDPSSPKPCKCKRSKCLKLYCDCFGADRLCGRSCTCSDCRNTGRAEHEDERKGARDLTLQRNPHAFTSKIMATPDSAQHAVGCKCKRSGCLKKYCECFANSVHCGPQCKCTGCENVPGSTALEAKAASPAMQAPPTSSASRKRPLAEHPQNSSPSRRGDSGSSRLRFETEEAVEEEEEDRSMAVKTLRSSSSSSSGAIRASRRHGVMALPPMHEGNMLVENGDSQPSLLGSLDLEMPISEHTLDMVGGETSMDAAVVFGTQESKGSLGSGSLRHLPSPPNVKMVKWGDHSMPESATLKCLSYLSTNELLSLGVVSKFWQTFVTSDALWHFGENPAPPASQGSSTQ